MNIDGQGSNPESQSYGNNDDIHIQENLSPNNCGNNVENVHHSKANVRAVIIIVSETDIREDFRTEENYEQQTDDE